MAVVYLYNIAHHTKVELHTQAAGVGLHVSGNQIVDGSGSPVTLRGGQIEILNRNIPSPDWNNFATTVATMKNIWNMNIVRLPTCAWRWQAAPTTYMDSVNTVVNVATSAGLYVILDSHDDNNCNPTYPAKTEPYHLPRPGMDTYIETLASTFKTNPRVIIDVYNEPAIQGRGKDQYTATDWQEWLNGGPEPDGQGGTVNYIGEQTLVDDVRSIDTTSLVMVEGYAHAETYMGIGNNFVHDSANNLVYEVHNYSMNPSGSQSGNDTYWQNEFGFMGSQFPLFIGEWALMGGDNSGQTNCGNTSQAESDNVTTWFLDFMAQNGWGWTAYSFTSEHLIDPNGNSTGQGLDYTPTTFDGFTWTCGTQTPPIPGMGKVIFDYLTKSPPPPVSGDCNADGHVTVTDLSLLLSNYNQPYAPCDFNKDGTVSILDLSILISNYGT